MTPSRLPPLWFRDTRGPLCSDVSRGYPRNWTSAARHNDHAPARPKTPDVSWHVRTPRYTTGSLIVDGGLMPGVAEFNRAAAS
jgi:hypothetical protein